MSWAPATRTNDKPASSASTERLGDDLAERLRRVRAHEHAAVDEERRRALDSQGARLLQVGLHGGGEGASVPAAGEALPVDRKVDRVADQVFPLVPRLLLEEAVLVRPVPPPRPPTTRRLLGRAPPNLDRQRQGPSPGAPLPGPIL